MPPENSGKVTITLYIDTDLVSKIKEMAEKLDRSVNYTVVQLIRDSLKLE